MQSEVFIGSTSVLASSSTYYDELAFLLMLQRCVVIVCVSVLSVLLCTSAEDAPITWPDARHFHVSLDQRWSNALTLNWPVSEYCPQNGILRFSASITKVGDSKILRNVSGTIERLYATLEQGEAEYLITAEMKTTFNVHGVSANARIKTSGKLFLI